MIDLNLKLKQNSNYINSGTLFSKLLGLSDVFKKEEAFLIVVENEKTLKSYLKISDYLGIKINQLSNISDLINLLYNKSGKYIVSKDLFNVNISIDSQFEYKNLLKISINSEIDISELSKKLNEFGYFFSEYKSSGTYKRNGDIYSVTDLSGNTININLWGNNVESIITQDNKELKDFYIGLNKEIDFNLLSQEFNKSINQKLNFNKIYTILDSLDFYSSYDSILENSSNYISFNSLSTNNESINLGINDLYIENLDSFKLILENKNTQKYIFTKNKQTIKNFIELNNLSGIQIFETNLNNLKSFQSIKFIVICDDNISRIFIKKRIKRSLSKNLDLLMQIRPGDYIVHIDHGIGIFKEIITKKLETGLGKQAIQKEYISLEYKNNDKLFVPITEVSRVSKYVGVENPKLTGLSTKEWEKKLKKATEDVEVIAGELLELYAKRKLSKGYSFMSFPKEESRFFNSFEYIYTDDQLNIINEIFKDMEASTPMDRLLSGDVGFGKTEIAFASIFKSLINGKQAALISPLIVLAYEHFEKAKERFQIFPFNIEVITRFEKASSIKSTLNKLKLGQIDLIIGTHRLLSEDIIFKDLGLLVVDEEHKFGVKDKEKIKRFKGEIDILSMSATPIPRSLNMALNGIKSISMLTTPPIGRQDIQTMVSSFDDKLIFEAGKREFARKGQIFFIHNRVDTIEAMKTYLSNLFPGKKIVVAHGQLLGDKLEQRIIEFKRRQYDILLATTVVENGIDFSNVNTIFINQAQNFGISQIHQLRGRVGRSERKGYCYLLFKKDKIKEDAAKRLKTIVDYSHLGAGFELAVKDLEIRGGGDLLGIRQSGQSHEIGVNLFLEMLENKVAELKDNSRPVLNSSLRISTIIDLNLSAFIDDSLFSSELDKINFYREIESLDNLVDLENIIQDFKKININLSEPSINFFNLLRLKIKASIFKIKVIKKTGVNYQLDFDNNIKVDGLKKFLDLDKDVKFCVINIHRLRTSYKNFENEKKFLEYMLQLFDGKLLKKKIKLKRL